MSLKSTLIFVTGAALGLVGGFVAGYKIMDKKTKQEIEEIRDFYANRDTNETKIIYEEEVSDDDENHTEDAETGVEDEQNPVEYARKIANSYHTPYGGHGGSTDTDSSDTQKERQIKVITEEEFEHHEFEKGSLTYYADHVLVDDDNGEVIDDIQSTVTYPALDQFNEEGMLYVENQFTYMVYEIQEDPRPYYAGEY